MDLNAGLKELMAKRLEIERFQAIELYQPYPYQQDFHFSEGFGTPGKLAKIRGLMAANQVGKTKSAASEVSMHLTGRYPDDWKGWRFTKPVNWLCGSKTNELTRDVVQKELCGEPADPNQLGTGTIPKHAIKDTARKPGVPGAYDSVLVRHISGGLSKLSFRAYEQGAAKHMGLRIDGGWMDEEPPQDIYSQYMRGTIATDGIIMLTFTPEEGITQIVYRFMFDLDVGMSLTRATWDDAPHLTEEMKAEKIGQLPAAEREMRSRGIPTVGSGLIFPVSDDSIKIDPIEIPDHWMRIIGVDLGYDHPFAVACMAFDLDTNTAYLYDTFRQTKMKIADCCSAINHRADGWIPVTYPHDAMKHDPQSARPFANIFEEDYGVPMLPEPFTNPPGEGQLEGEGGRGVEVGLHSMLQAMEEGRFKVFSTCEDFFEEKAMYHRKQNSKTGTIQITALRDDVISAARYAYQSMRHAQAKRFISSMGGGRVIHRGLTNW